MTVIIGLLTSCFHDTALLSYHSLFHHYRASAHRSSVSDELPYQQTGELGRACRATVLFQVQLAARETNAHVLPRLVQQTLLSTLIDYTGCVA